MAEREWRYRERRRLYMQIWRDLNRERRNQYERKRRLQKMLKALGYGN